jgi:hypothetical protein
VAFIVDQYGNPILDESGVGVWDEAGQPSGEIETATTTVRDIAMRALSAVPNCNYIQGERAVREAIIEFCESTWALERFFGFNVPEDGIDSSNFNMVRINLSDEIEQMRPVAIQNMKVGETPTKAIRAKLVGALSPSSMLYGNEKFYDMPADAYLDILPFTETPPFTLSLKIAFVPPEGFTQIDTFFYQTHRRALLDGAISYMYEIPGKSWSNDRQATKYRARFDDKVVSTKIDMAIMQGGQNQRAQAPMGGWP